MFDRLRGVWDQARAKANADYVRLHCDEIKKTLHALKVLTSKEYGANNNFVTANTVVEYEGNENYVVWLQLLGMVDFVGREREWGQRLYCINELGLELFEAL